MPGCLCLKDLEMRKANIGIGGFIDAASGPDGTYGCIRQSVAG
jgi:hypothetical protein